MRVPSEREFKALLAEAVERIGVDPVYRVESLIR